MRISVIIPVYNNEKDLPAAIESVLSQDYADKELLIIDNKSTDNTREVVEQYRSNIAYFESKKDRGIYHAVNKGILHASGEAIGFIGADDTYKPGAFSAIAKAFGEHPNAALIYGEVEHVGVDGRLLGYHHAKQTTASELARTRCYVPCQAAFFRRDVVAEIGLMSTSYRWSSDWEYWIRISKSHQIVYINNIIGRWRINPNGVTYFNDYPKYYKRYLENIAISIKYGNNPFSRLARWNYLELAFHFLPWRETVRKFIRLARSRLTSKRNSSRSD